MHMRYYFYFYLHVGWFWQMTNEVGKAMFSKAGELGVPVGFMCMKVV